MSAAAPGGLSALVLAGERPGGDPLAREAGVPFKAAIAIAGRPMLHHVVDTLLACPAIGHVHVSGPAGLPIPANGRVHRLAPEASPSLSVLAALRELGTPLLVTTADHPLLRPQWVEYFLASLPREADVAAALARAEVVTSAEPTTARTFLKFREGRFSGCNLFYFAGPAALGVPAFWRRIEAHRKRPFAMARLIGPGAILGYLSGRLTLAGTLRRLGARTGARIAVVDMPFGEAAIDVDKPSDLRLVREIFAARARAAGETADRPADP